MDFSPFIITSTQYDLFKIISINDDGDVANLISVYKCIDGRDSDHVVHRFICGFAPDPANI